MLLFLFITLLMLFKAVAVVDYNVATVVVIAVYDGINNTIGYNSTYIINSYQKITIQALLLLQDG